MYMRAWKTCSRFPSAAVHSTSVAELTILRRLRTHSMCMCLSQLLPRPCLDYRLQSRSGASTSCRWSEGTLMNLFQTLRLVLIHSMLPRCKKQLYCKISYVATPLFYYLKWSNLDQSLQYLTDWSTAPVGVRMRPELKNSCIAKSATLQHHFSTV